MSCWAFVIIILFTVFHVGFSGVPRVIGMEVIKDGYLKSGTERTDRFGLTLHLDEYTNENQDCLKVLRIEQPSPWKLVDEVMVSCDYTEWSVTNTMVSYGKIIHIQTAFNMVAWAVFDMGGKCFQRIYSDMGGQQLARTELVLTREEFKGVLRSQMFINNPAASYAVEPEGTYSAFSNEDSAVLAMDDKVDGYALKSKSTVSSGSITLDVSYYHKHMECVRVVVIYIYRKEVQKGKISCGPANSRYVNGKLQFGKAFTIRPGSSPVVFKAVYNLPGDDCVRRTYTVTGFPIQFAMKDEKTSDDECMELKEGKDALDYSPRAVKDDAVKGRGADTPEEQTDYQSDGEGENADEESSDGDESASSAQNMNQVKVLALNGNMRGYKSKGSQETDNDGSVRIQSENFYKPNGECVKLVTIVMHGLVAQQLKLTCATVTSRQLNGHHQYGAAFTFRPESGSDNYIGLFNLRDEFCVRFVYSIVQGQKTQITKSKGVKTKKQECKDLMRGRDLISTGDNNNANSNPDYPPAPTVSVIVMNGDINGYKALDTPSVIKDDNVLIESQDLHKTDGKCAILVSIKVRGVLAQQLKMTCAPFSSRAVNGHYQYGSAFTIRPDSDDETYRGLFNIRNEFCFRITFTYMDGETPTIRKSKIVRTKNGECKDLIEGKDMIGPDGRGPSDVIASDSSSSDDAEGKADAQEGNLVASNTPPPSPTGSSLTDIQTHVAEGKADAQEVNLVASNTPPPSPTGSSTTDIQTDENMEGQAVTQEVNLEASNTPPPPPTGSSTTSIQISDTEAETNAQEGNPVAPQPTPPSPTGVQTADKQTVLAMDNDVDGYPIGTGRTDLNDGTLLIVSQDMQNAEGKCVKVIVISINDAVAQRLQTTCGELSGRTEKGQYQYGTAFMIWPESGKYNGLYNYRDEHCFKVTYKVKKGNPNTIKRSKEIPTKEPSCKMLMEGKDLVSRDMKSLTSTAGIIQRKRVVVGWVKGLFSKIFQGLFGRFRAKPKAQKDCNTM